MHALFAELNYSNRMPELIVNGGSRTGVLGLSAYIARLHGVQTLGFTPLQGLDNMAPQSQLIVGGNTYRDREKLVGAAADVLTVWGGQGGTERECEAAVDRHIPVFMVNSRAVRRATFPGLLQNTVEGA
jgi:predicted Rossmann-fold nucleotide-binding protein